MSVTLALVGEVLTAHGTLALAGDDLAPTGAADPNINLTIWASLTGLITPFAVAFVNQPQWSPLARALMTLAVAAGLGAATAAVEGQLTGTRWAAAALIIAAAGVAAYKRLWPEPAHRFELWSSRQSSGRHAAPGE